MCVCADAVKALAASGTELDWPHPEDGRTPIHAAACFDHVAALTALIDAGAGVVGASVDLVGATANAGMDLANAGLGLLTGRWLAQHGARRLILASRNGALAHDTASEWEAMRATGAAARSLAAPRAAIPT